MARKTKRLDDATRLTTIVNFVLDRSGSMNSIKPATIAGFNEYLGGLQTADTPENQFLFSLNLFSASFPEQRYTLTPVKEVEPLSATNYLPNGGTPLYDAIMGCLGEVERQMDLRSDKPAILTVIMTDGEENSSQKATLVQVKAKIDELTAQGNWTFVYLGTRQDAWVDSDKLGIGKKNTMSWQASNVGTMTVMDNLSSATVSYSTLRVKQNPMGDPLAGYSSQDFFAQQAQPNAVPATTATSALPKKSKKRPQKVTS